MSDKKKTYRTVVGTIQFDPKDGTANEKPVRNITVQQAGFGPTAVRVSATVWPSHKNVPLKKGDVVAFEGSYEQRKSTGDDGEERTFHNISVLRLTVLGSVSEGSESGGSSTASPDVEEVNDDDIPF